MAMMRRNDPVEAFCIAWIAAGGGVVAKRHRAISDSANA